MLKQLFVESMSDPCERETDHSDKSIRHACNTTPNEMGCLINGINRKRFCFETESPSN